MKIKSYRYTYFGFNFLLNYRVVGWFSVTRQNFQSFEIHFIQMYEGRRVETPYGIGVVKSKRSSDNILVVESELWNLANKKPATLYMNPKDVQVIYQVGDEVQCFMGTGSIQDIRDDKIHVVTLKNWILANSKSPQLYLQPKSLTLINKEAQNAESSPAESVQSCLNKCSKFKAEAATLFEKQEYLAARAKYFDALSALKVRILTGRCILSSAICYSYFYFIKALYLAIYIIFLTLIFPGQCRRDE